MTPDPTQFRAIALLVSQQTPNSIASSLIWIGGIIAAVRRKRPIGGWLFFFFWQVLAGCAVTLAYTDWPRYLPHVWIEQQLKYLAFVLVTAPRILALAAIAGIGAMLIRSYEWRWVVVLRYVLVIFSIFGLVSVAADFFYFPERVRPDIATLIFPVVYTIYFSVSTRVRSVFRDRVWNHTAI